MSPAASTPVAVTPDRSVSMEAGRGSTNCPAEPSGEHGRPSSWARDVRLVAEP